MQFQENTLFGSDGMPPGQQTQQNQTLPNQANNQAVNQSQHGLMLGGQPFMELFEPGENGLLGQPIGLGNEDIITGGNQSVLNGGDPLENGENQNQSNLQVLNIYANKDNFAKSGIFNGGLDVGIDPMRLSVDFNIKE